MSKAKKLTRAEKQQINAAIQNARRQDKRHKSAQDSIPFQRMFPDGICRVTDHYYTKTVQFQDINYQLNQNEDKAAIFDGWCDFLNYFDSSVRFELSFINTAANKDTYSERIAIPLKGDSYDSIRAEYTQMLKNQLAKGNNGLIKTKYLTFGIEADSLKSAKLRLERIETDVLNNFKRLGVQADPMNGKQRLELLHGIFHMDQDHLSLYASYMSTLGNRPDLFAGSSYVDRYYGDQYRYEIPADALEDEQFAAMIQEAEKYLGYPYVWGGSSPSTSFDCSGFVSWVINHCGVGWNVGRLGAEGLRNICSYVSPANAKPGDLIFFEKTYDTSGASHVGIYVGNNMMIHCGDPIQYTSIDTNYWQQHFLQFGRLPSP